MPPKQLLNDTYTPDDSICYTERLWDGQQKIEARAKAIKQFDISSPTSFSTFLRTYEALEKRYTKNFTVEDKYFLEIKARKFEPLAEHGFVILHTLSVHLFSTLDNAWQQMKVSVEAIEKNAKDRSVDFKALLDTEQQEQKEFEAKYKQIDSQWTAAKKKRQQSLDELAKVYFCTTFRTLHILPSPVIPETRSLSFYLQRLG